VGADSIPRDVVSAVTQDRAGFLWVGTGNGLVRYDGYRFQPQERESPIAAQRNLGWVRTLLAARDGKVWISTEAQGLAVYDPSTGTIDIRAQEEDDAGMPRGGARDVVTAMAEEKDGTLWVGHLEGGLVKYDPRNHTAWRWHPSTESVDWPDQHIQALLVSRDGTVWVGTRQGLLRRLPSSMRFELVLSSRISGASSGGVQALLEAMDGRIWAGTRAGSVYRIDPATGKVDMVGPQQGLPGSHAVTSIAQEPAGFVWVGRKSGIDVYDGSNARWIRQIRHNASLPAGLAANEVTSLHVDRTGLVWVGGVGIGLQRHNPQNRSIRLVSLDQLQGTLDRDSDVCSVLSMANGETWVATQSGGLLVLDVSLVPQHSVRLDQAEGTGRQDSAAQPSIVVRAMAEARDGAIWLGADSVLHRLDRDRQHRSTITHEGGLTTRLLATGDGTLWVGTEHGLYRLIPGTTRLQRVAIEHGRTPASEVWALAEAPDRAVWVGSVDGLFRIPPGAAVLQPVLGQEGRGLANPIVIGLLFDRDGVLWLDTAVTGLHRMLRWDGQRAVFERISERHRIVNRPFGANLLQDARGRIWTHMSLYDPRSDQFDELTPADGVNLGNGRFMAYAKMTDGRLLFGGTKGLMVVDPEAFDRRSGTPPLVVSSLRIDGELRYLGLVPSAIELTARDRSLSLEFAALDFLNPGRIHYGFRLQGIDPEWVETSAGLRVAGYSNLPPGDHVLQVRSSTPRGDWSPGELSIPIRVLPAWWQTWVARLALAAILLALMIVWARWRVRFLRQRQAALEDLVRQRTSELESMSMELKHKSEILEASSLTDPLTGLRNRRFLLGQIDREVAQVCRRHESHLQHGNPLPADADMVLFMVDIDHFKAVNDEHGHAAGDEVLTQMRERLLQVFRSTDFLVRWGGEEFLVVALNTSRSHAAELAERLRVAVADQPFALTTGEQLCKTCSIGFACLPLDPAHPRALNWTDLVELADEALYRAKRSGRDGWMGIVQVRGETDESLQVWLRRPLEEWQATGALQVASSIS
jgi:diguanylate cyclase (GGDEF)-like protein